MFVQMLDWVPEITALVVDADVMKVGDKSYSIVQLFEMGGVMMYPILALSMLAVFVVIICFFVTRPGNVMSRKFMESSESLIMRSDLVGLEYLCEKDDSCMARIVLRTTKFMVSYPEASLEEIRDTAATEGARQAGGLTRKISWLSDIGAVAPMFGLLGTVMGMMKTFFEIYEGNFEGVMAKQMAGGVAEALLTTAAGLLVGIPALLVYAYFRGLVEKNVSNLESASAHVVSLLWATKLRGEKRGTRPGIKVGSHAENLPPVRHDRI